LDWKEIKERFLTVLIFTGLFLPARLFFYNIISTVWIGSFGMMTAIMLSTLYLARKNKLGYVGYLINKHATSFSKGKFGKIAIIFLVFNIYMFGIAIYGIENYQPEYKEKITGQLADQGVHDLDTATHAENVGWSGPAASFGILFSLAILLIPNQLGFSIYSIINDYTNGWILHFATVFLVEQLEILGLVIFFRYFYKSKPIEI